MLAVETNSGLILRPVQLDDAELLLAWRNDSYSKEVSLSSEHISLSEHLSWVVGKLKDPACLHLLALDGSSRVPVGVTRFDVRGDRAQVSVNTDPGMRKRGLGLMILSASIDILWAKYNSCNVIDATIKCFNIPSIKIFERAGFVHVSTKGDALLYELHR